MAFRPAVVRVRWSVNTSTPLVHADQVEADDNVAQLAWLPQFEEAGNYTIGRWRNHTINAIFTRVVVHVVISEFWMFHELLKKVSSLL